MKSKDLLLFFLIASCLSLSNCADEIDIKPYDKYISDNFEKYQGIREALIDTLTQWKRDSLVVTSSIFYDELWQVDSILLFSIDSSRLFTTINERNCYSKGSRSDFIEGITGVRIKNKWHFHFGASRIVSRKGRKKDIDSAMSFEELSYLSHTGAMARFLFFDKDGKYFIDYDEMDNDFYKGYRSLYPNIDKIDSLIITRIVAYKRKKLDVKEIENVKESRQNSVRPDDPETDNISWWDKIFDKEEVGLFETEAWKNRRKN